MQIRYVVADLELMPDAVVVATSLSKNQKRGTKAYVYNKQTYIVKVVDDVKTVILKPVQKNIWITPYSYNADYSPTDAWLHGITLIENPDYPGLSNQRYIKKYATPTANYSFAAKDLETATTVNPQTASVEVLRTKEGDRPGPAQWCSADLKTVVSWFMQPMGDDVLTSPRIPPTVFVNNLQNATFETLFNLVTDKYCIRAACYLPKEGEDTEVYKLFVTTKVGSSYGIRYVEKRSGLTSPVYNFTSFPSRYNNLTFRPDGACALGYEPSTTVYEVFPTPTVSGIGDSRTLSITFTEVPTDLAPLLPGYGQVIQPWVMMASSVTTVQETSGYGTYGPVNWTYDVYGDNGIIKSYGNAAYTYMPAPGNETISVICEGGLLGPHGSAGLTYLVPGEYVHTWVTTLLAVGYDRNSKIQFLYSTYKRKHVWGGGGYQSTETGRYDPNGVSTWTGIQPKELDSVQDGTQYWHDYPYLTEEHYYDNYSFSSDSWYRVEDEYEVGHSQYGALDKGGFNAIDDTRVLTSSGQGYLLELYAWVVRGTWPYKVNWRTPYSIDLTESYSEEWISTSRGGSSYQWPVIQHADFCRDRFLILFSHSWSESGSRSVTSKSGSYSGLLSVPIPNAVAYNRDVYYHGKNAVDIRTVYISQGKSTEVVRSAYSYNETSSSTHTSYSTGFTNPFPDGQTGVYQSHSTYAPPYEIGPYNPNYNVGDSIVGLATNNALQGEGRVAVDKDGNVVVVANTYVNGYFQPKVFMMKKDGEGFVEVNCGNGQSPDFTGGLKSGIFLSYPG